MSATSSSIRGRGLVRSGRGALLGGVCAGLARTLRTGSLPVRIVFVGLAAAGGLGIGLYLAAWALLPADDGSDAPALLLRVPRAGRGIVETAMGTGLLLLAALLTLRQVGLPFSDVLVWPLVLLAAGAGVLWRNSVPTTPGAVDPPSSNTASRTSLGVVLVALGAFAFLGSTGAIGAARDAALGALTVAVVLSVVFAPYLVRLWRSLGEERAARIRSQERAEVAAHLHDSVLQTLALVQRRADDPREVSALARRQERELRAWLSGRRPAGEAPATVVAALETAAADVESAHGARVEVVAVGDAPIDARAEALVAAAREAMVNAAKFAAGETVDVFAEAGQNGLEVFVRDRGPGFDPEAVPADRRGLRESIVGRMERHGGRATIRSAFGEGTEVELVLPS